MAEANLSIEEIGTTRMYVPIVGTSPLIVNKFSEKAKQAMLEGFQGKKSQKPPKNPEAEYQDAFYRIHKEGQPDGYGFPSIGFKAATVSAARFYPSAKMTELRQFIFFKGIFTKADSQQLTEIVGEPEMREDVTRTGMTTTHLRYRPMFAEWSAMLDVTFVHNSIDQNSVLSLINAGGMGVGVGEWRVEKKGDFGTYMVDPEREVHTIVSGVDPKPEVPVVGSKRRK